MKRHISAQIPVEMYILIKQLKGYKKISDIIRETLERWIEEKAGKKYEELAQEVNIKLQIYSEVEMIKITSKSAKEMLEKLKQLEATYGISYSNLKKIYKEIEELL